MKRVGKSLFYAGLAAGVAFGALMPESAQAEWEPQRPIEMVIQTPPGGGSDIYTRQWLGIINKEDLSPVPITPVNMPGGAGAVSLTYLWSQRGDPHYIAPTLNSIVTTPLQQQIPVMYTSQDLTPIALLTIDPFMLWVNPDKYKNWEEFHQACQEKRLTGSGTGARQEDEIQIGLLNEAAGCKDFRYIPEAGGGDVAASVAGGHVDFSVNQPAEGVPHYPDNMHPIVTFAEERFDAFPDSATHWELGIGTENDGEFAKLLDVQTGLHQHRGIIGPPDMPEEAKQWYEDLFRKVFESEGWQEFMDRHEMVKEFKGPDEYKEWLVDFENNHIRMMRDTYGWPLRDDLVPQEER